MAGGAMSLFSQSAMPAGVAAAANAAVQARE
jgi:hypothetical protein